MPNILIIGSKGFIGKNTLNYFSEKFGESVFGADVTVDYTSSNYILIDASNSDFKTVFKEHNFDFCINCSGAANVSQSMSNPSRDYYLNTHNVFKILEALRVHNPTCKFITLSSAAVYGNPNTLPITEGDEVHPISPYGWHKLQSELLCKEYYQQFKIPTVSLRIFSVYGPGLKKQLFWDLFQKHLKMDQIELWGTGNESRDFIYIDDLIQVFELIMEGGVFSGESINVANGEEVFIKDAVSYYYNTLSPTINYTFKGNHRPGDPNNWKANISKLKALGYQRKIGFEEGLSHYLNWIQKVHHS